jgi:hypothetical protein
MKNPALRANELRRIFNDRYGPVYPNDDAGREDLALLLGQLAQLRGVPFAIDNALGERAPWMPADERGAFKQAAATAFVWWDADDLGRKIGLTMEQRTRLSVRTIGAIDCDRQARQALRKEKNRDRERARRRRERRQLKRRPIISPRGMAVFEALPPSSWHTVTWLIEELKDDKLFAGVVPASLRRLVKRALADAEKNHLVKTKTEDGPRGKVMFVTRDEHWTRETVPIGTTTGTRHRVQC